MLTSLPGRSDSMRSKCMAYVSHCMTAFSTECLRASVFLHSHTHKPRKAHANVGQVYIHWTGSLHTATSRPRHLRICFIQQTSVQKKSWERAVWGQAGRFNFTTPSGCLMNDKNASQSTVEERGMTVQLGLMDGHIDKVFKIWCNQREKKGSLKLGNHWEETMHKDFEVSRFSDVFPEKDTSNLPWVCYRVSKGIAAMSQSVHGFLRNNQKILSFPKETIPPKPIIDATTFINFLIHQEKFEIKFDPLKKPLLQFRRRTFPWFIWKPENDRLRYENRKC